MREPSAPVVWLLEHGYEPVVVMGHVRTFQIPGDAMLVRVVNVGEFERVELWRSGEREPRIVSELDPSLTWVDLNIPGR